MRIVHPHTDLVTAFDGGINTFLHLTIPAFREVFLDTRGAVADNPGTSATGCALAERLEREVQTGRK
jgi:hypothetical protein